MRFPWTLLPPRGRTSRCVDAGSRTPVPGSRASITAFSLWDPRHVTLPLCAPTQGQMLIKPISQGYVKTQLVNICKKNFEPWLACGKQQKNMNTYIDGLLYLLSTRISKAKNQVGRIVRILNVMGRIASPRDSHVDSPVHVHTSEYNRIWR